MIVANTYSDCTVADARSRLAEWLARVFPGRLGLSIDEFAAALGYSRGHVKNLIAAHKVNVHRAGRRVVIPMDSAIMFMLAAESGTGEGAEREQGRMREGIAQSNKP